MSTVRREGGKVCVEGVRKVSWDTGEMCEFASAFVAAMDCLGESVPYHYVMGTAGVAFRFTLNPGQWDFTNYSIRNITPDTYAPVRRAFAAAGYACVLRERGSFDDDAAAIMGSIDRGIPVLAFRVVGPADCCIITGYDEDGKVLLGWSTFQNIPDDHSIPHDVTGYFRKPGWHDGCPGYILIGAKATSLPPQRVVYRNALEWAVHLMRTPRMGHTFTGLEGLRRWAEEMRQEEYFPRGDSQLLGQRYVSTTINITMLRDHCLAEPFLRQAAEDVPDLGPELSRAADFYGEVKSLRAGMDDLVSDDFGERSMKAIADAGVRNTFADTILRIRAVEDQAAGCLECLLRRCE